MYEYRYGVLPMAIARDTVVAITLAGTTLDVSNHIDNLFPAYSFVPDPTQLVDTDNHVWANYALAAYKGVHDYLTANPASETPVSRQFPGIKVCLFVLFLFCFVFCFVYSRSLLCAVLCLVQARVPNSI